MKTAIASVLLCALLVSGGLGQQVNLGPGCYFAINPPGQSGYCDSLSASMCDFAVSSTDTQVHMTFCGQPNTTGYVFGTIGPPAYNPQQCAPCGCYGFIDLDLTYPAAQIFVVAFGNSGGNPCLQWTFNILPFVNFGATLQGMVIGDHLYNPLCQVCTTMAVYIHRP